MGLTTNEAIQADLQHLILVGRNNARSRKFLTNLSGYSDRELRIAIATSNLPIISISANGGGYFIPDMNDPADVNAMHAYLAQERARIQSLEEKLERKFDKERLITGSWRTVDATDREPDDIVNEQLELDL